MPAVLHFLQEGENVICVFCRGEHLDLRDGWTGYWKIKPVRLQGVNRVIVYLRGENSNIIYKGNYTGWRPAPSAWPGRITILVDGFREVGETEVKWPEFGNGSPYPVQVIHMN